MAMGKKRARQQPMWVATGELPRTRGHALYDRVNEILKDEKCDELSNRGKPGSAKANRCPFDPRVKVISGLVLVVSMQLSAKKGSGSGKGHTARQSDRGGCASATPSRLLSARNEGGRL